MLKRLYVDNFRCLTNFDVTPAPVAVLVGPNGGGKSSVVEALRCSQAVALNGQSAADVFPFGSLTRWDRRLEQRIELEASLEDATYQYSLVLAQDPGRRLAHIRQESLSSNGELLYRLADAHVGLYGDRPTSTPRTSFPFTSTRSFLPLLEERPDNTRITAFKRWLQGIWLFALRPQDIAPVSQGEETALASSGSNFVSWYRVLAQEYPEIVVQVRADLAPVVSGLKSIRLRDVGPGSKVVKLECEVGNQTVELSLDELSDGQRALAVLYTIARAVAQRASLLVFDEPDNYLAANEIQPWLSALREAVVEAGRCTLLVVSHHPEVVDYLAADEALFFWRGEDGPTRVRPLEVDRTQGLTASESLRLGATGAE